MFDVTTNQVIKIHKGDSSTKFSFMLNLGTKLNIVKYKFYPEISMTRSPSQLKVSLDKEKFNTKVIADGFYDFEYNYLYDEAGKRIGGLGWYLNKILVNLNDYGITYTGTPEKSDHIIMARFKDHISELYFYILDYNADLDHCLIRKTFRTNGEVITEFADCRIPSIEDKYDTVNDDNNMVLKLDSTDTMCLMSGEYAYQIRAKLYDIKEDDYKLKTVTNRLPFYVVDGEDSIVW